MEYIFKGGGEQPLESTYQAQRKPYVSPAIIYELLLETRAQPQAGSNMAPLDPGLVDPELPPKPGAPSGGGIDEIDPPLPPKPVGRPGSSDPGSIDPPLPPKPPSP